MKIELVKIDEMAEKAVSVRILADGIYQLEAGEIYILDYENTLKITLERPYVIPVIEDDEEEYEEEYDIEAAMAAIING